MTAGFPEFEKISFISHRALNERELETFGGRMRGACPNARKLGTLPESPSPRFRRRETAIVSFRLGGGGCIHCRR